MIKLKEGSKQAKVFAVLKDKKFHCRGHEYPHVDSKQLAGGGGIQGLQRGTRTRPGICIETVSRDCRKCGAKQKWDRWTGNLQKANAAAGIPKALAERIRAYYRNVDEIELRERPSHELVIEHRFPMNRWGGAEQKLSANMTEAEIARKFQLLKKDGSGNHNLLKSRACEVCLATGKRGTPFGIRFFYHGDESWPEGIPACGAEAERGCVGCGWYDVAKWRDALNLKLADPAASSPL